MVARKVRKVWKSWKELENLPMLVMVGEGLEAGKERNQHDS